MFIDYPETLSVDSFAERDIYDEILEIEDDLDRQTAINKVRARAKELQTTKMFDDMLKSAQRAYAKIQKRELKNSSEVFGTMLTEFTALDKVLGSKQLNCGDWVADDDGVRLHSDKGIMYACPHAIIISKTLRNIETGKYKAEIVYQLPGKTNSIRSFCVDRKTLASASKILDIADDGVIVTSLTAPLLVKYLADLQTLNPELVVEIPSTSRLGWVTGFDSDGKPIKQFLPYQSKIEFDNYEMMYLFNSIQPHGDSKEWYEHVKQIRAKQQPEVLINLAASFASVLVEPCGGLPFIVSLWGGTGIGKTVLLKLCTSIWANPKEGQYIASSKSTYVGTEQQLNILNSLPLMIDDMAQLTMQSDVNLQEIIYNVCAGQGKTRGKKEGNGTRVNTRWKNCTITNGERSFVDESMQGGAINRVIDIEASGDALFSGKDGSETIKIIDKNYGHAGDDFIYQITELGMESLLETYNEQYERVKKAASKKGVEKEDKQVAPMALILTADYLTEKYLFCDGVRINIDQAVDYLKNKGDISETETTYERILDLISVNEQHFSYDPKTYPEPASISAWGCYLDDDKRYIAIIPDVFKDLVGSNSLEKTFKSWARRQGILDTDGDKKRFTKTIRYHGIPHKMIVLDTTWKKPGSVDVTEIEEDYDEPPFK